MSTLNKFFKIIASYKWGLLMNFVIFGGLAILLTFIAVGNESDEFERLTDVNVAIFDRDETELTRVFLDHFTENHNVIEIEDTDDAWLDAVSFNVAMIVVEIPAGFTENFGSDNQLSIEFLVNPQHVQGFLVRGQIESYFNILATYLAGGFDVVEAGQLVVETLENPAEVQLVAVEGERFGEIYVYFRFLPLPLVIVITIALGGVFMALNKQDIVRRIDSSPASFKRRTFERIVASLLFSFAGWALFMAIPIVLYGWNDMMQPENLLRVLNSLPLIFFGIALAFVITQFIEKREMLMGFVFPVVFGLATPAGIMFDLSMMGEQVLAVARFTPLYWYTRVNEMLIWENAIDFELIGQSLLIQLVFAAAVLSVGLVFNKERRTRRG